MRRIDAEMWAAIFGTLVSVAVGLPVLILGARGQALTTGPAWVWWLCFAGYVAAQVVCMWLPDRLAARLVRAALAAQVAFGAVLALTAPRAGWTSILLIYTAGMSVYLVRWPVTTAIIVLNTAVAASAAALAGGGPVGVLVTGTLYLLLQLATAAGVLAQRRAEESNRNLAAAHTELRAAAALLAESSRADERLSIARELHDLLGHQLTVLALELETASHKADPAEHVARANKVARDLLADVRATVGQLRQRAPDLRATLERIVADLPAPRVHLSVGADVRADEARTATLIRCVQEVITNAIRHAHATEVWIEIRTGADGAIVFDAHDDGCGADRVVMGNGLTGIAERVRALGGHARFDGRTGFRVVAEVPAP
ncbi:MAG TPA: histidine kinase [Actinoplanes sp.]|nr:histidine kinase [Actinoplanes sp.]